MSLSWRLIISYIVIILVTLVLALVTLILISRPIENRLIKGRLVPQARQIGRQVDNLYRQGASTATVIQQLNRWPPDSNTRLIFANTQGQVLVDSQNQWAGQQLNIPDIDAEFATFRAPNGQSIIYAATPVGPPNEPVGFVATIANRPPFVPAFITELGGGFLLAGIVALLLSLLLGVLIARSIALPLQRIARATGAVAAGDYEHRLPEQGPPEVKRVATSFNVMAAQVQASQQAMRDFVSNVSHELKTPLTSIQGFSQAIMEGATQDEAARRRAADIIHQEASRMSRLVEDLLDLARIDSGQIVMQKTRLDLLQILESTINRLLPQAASKEIKLVKRWIQLPRIVGDGDRLAQVFTNLLSNAIKYTPPGGQVTITGKTTQGTARPRQVQPGSVRPDATTLLSERGQFIEISISDTGPGIPAEDLGRIFERFYQVDKSRKRGQGTGLGLTITKEIIEAHGGYVRAESVEGVGTKFIILLPTTEADVKTLVSVQRE